MRGQTPKALVTCAAVVGAVIWVIASSRSGILEGRQQVNELLKRREALVQEIDGLELLRDKRVDELDARRAEGDGLTEGLRSALMLAGEVSARGPGVVVTLDDAPRSMIVPGNPSAPVIVHDEDVLRVIGALRAGGAEALSISGVRVTGTTRIRCGGPIISVRTTRLTPPFVLSAIGDAQRLSAALEEGALTKLITAFGVRLTVEKRDELDVPKLAVPVAMEFAKFVQ